MNVISEFLWDAFIMGFYGHPMKAFIGSLVNLIVGSIAAYGLMYYVDNNDGIIKSQSWQNFFWSCLGTHLTISLFSIVMIICYGGFYNCLTGVIRNSLDTNTALQAKQAN